MRLIVAHVLRAPEDAPDAHDDARVFAFEEGWRADATGLVCCHLDFDPDVHNPLLEALHACGYESEASFSKAFKRRYGIAPGALRRAER